MSSNEVTWKDKLKAYTRTPGSLIVMLLVMLSAIMTFAVLIFLIVYVLAHGVPYLKPSIFSLHYTSENASLMPALINTVIMTLLSLLIAVPFGIFAAIFLVEYAKRGNKFVEVIRLTTETLQGIPSIVYGLFGMLFFVNTCKWGIFDSGRSVYSCDHGITADHEKYRRSIEIRTGFLQRRKFRTGSRKITYSISDRTSIGNTWNPCRCDPGDRTNRRRDSSIDLYSRYCCKGAEECIEFRKNPGSAHV